MSFNLVLLVRSAAICANVGRALSKSHIHAHPPFNTIYRFLAFLEFFVLIMAL
jgi:hypothetical protein